MSVKLSLLTQVIKSELSVAKGLIIPSSEAASPSNHPGNTSENIHAPNSSSGTPPPKPPNKHRQGHCDGPHVWCFAGGANVGQAKAWLVGNKGLPEADVASTQKKILAALDYSSSPSRELWLWKGED
ncbi:hypothetical protein DSO57_1010468 [Entomophthora muscae]|uniref:Uncharacterized protein n=1 Tax=Entomophthora muscae TaxID=34485 RepID=A0ACC2TUF3_9FUNG|nr:hypothetical protein DSO57_1010468 [Entomophthora muscae]